MIVEILDKSLEGIINLLFAIFPIEPNHGLVSILINADHIHIRQRAEKQKCDETDETQK